MKKFLITLISIFILAVGIIAFLIINSFSPKNFQEQITQSITELSGRDFNVMGDAKVVWFPSPKIVLNNISLANVAGSTRGVMFHADKAEINLQWSALLKSPLVIAQVDITRPTIYLEQMSTKENNWSFPFLKNHENSIDEPFSATPRTIAINALNIIDGTINYENMITQNQLALTNFNGKVVADSLQGPYTFQGLINIFDTPITTTLNINKLQMDTPTPFTGTLKSTESIFDMDLNGQIISTNQADFAITSNASFSLHKPNALLQKMHLPILDKSLDIASSGNLTYELTNNAANLKSLTIRFGDTPNAVALTGSLNRKIHNNAYTYESSIAINTLDMAKWHDFFTKITTSTPTDFSLKANIQDFIFNQLNGKNIAFNITGENNNISLSTLTATLNDKTTLSATGNNETTDNQAGFLFNVKAQSSNLGDIIAAYPPMAKLIKTPAKNAQFEGKVFISSGIQKIDIASLKLDSTTVKGTVSLDNASDKTNMDIAINNINFDSFINHTPKATSLKALLPDIKSYLSTLTTLSTYNAAFNIDFNDATLHNLPITSGNIKGVIKGKKLSFENIAFNDIATADIKIKGFATNIGTKNATLDALVLSLKTAKMPLFLSRANIDLHSPILNKANTFETTTSITSDKNSWSVDSKNIIDKTNFDFKGNIDITHDNITYSKATVNIYAPNYTSFLSQIDKNNIFNKSLNGKFTFSTTLDGAQSDLSFKNIKIDTSVYSFTGAATLQQLENKSQLILNLSTPLFEPKYYLPGFIDKLLTVQQKPITFKLLPHLSSHITITADKLTHNGLTLDKATMEIKADDTTFDIATLSGIQNQNPDSLFKANAKIDIKSTPTISGNITTKDISLNANIISNDAFSFGNGLLTLDADFATSGTTYHTIIDNLSAKGSFDIKNSTFVGANLSEMEPTFQKAINYEILPDVIETTFNRLLKSGKTTIPALFGPFVIEKGVVKMVNTSLEMPNLSANPLQITYTIKSHNLDISAPMILDNYPDLPPFALFITGNTNNLTYNPTFMDFSNAIKEKIAAAKAQNKTTLQSIITNTTPAPTPQPTTNKRQSDIETAIQNANASVENATLQLQNGENLVANALLNEAREKLAQVNTLSQKEVLADNEYLQLMELSRATILKSNDSLAAIKTDAQFANRQQINTLLKESQDMITTMQDIQKAYPSIVIISRLIPPSQQQLQIIAQLADDAKNSAYSTQEYDAAIIKAQSAYDKIKNAHTYTLKFNTTTPSTPNTTTNPTDLINQTTQPPEPTPTKIPTETPKFRGLIQKSVY